MITVHWKGRFGNQLFQYACGRLLAEHHGLKLNCPEHFSLDLFKPAPVYGDVLDSPTRILTDYDRADWFRGPRGKILLDGYFQDAGLYEPFRELIVDEFYPLPEVNMVPRIGCHVRLTDMYRESRSSGLDGYLQALELMPDGLDVVVCTDEPTHPIIEGILEACKGREVVVSDQGAIADFLTIRESTHVIATWLSSFAWWATFLGEPEKVVLSYREGSKYSPSWRACAGYEMVYC